MARSAHDAATESSRREGLADISALRKPSTGWDKPRAVIKFVRGFLRTKALLSQGFAEKKINLLGFTSVRQLYSDIQEQFL